MQTLKPCPFCGGTNVDVSNTWTPSFWVECDDCSAQVHGESFQGPERKDRFSYSKSPINSFEATFEQLHPEYQSAAKSAIDAWNTRPGAPVDGLETVGATYLGYFYSKANRAVWPAKAHELVTRSQAVAIIAAERAAIPILKGTAFKSGDGWKDTTKEGEVCFVWNKMHPAPYEPGQYPRVGKEHWSASAENFTFESASPDEVVTLFSTLIADKAALTARVKELEAEFSALMGSNTNNLTAADRAYLIAHLSWELEPVGKRPSWNMLAMEIVRQGNKLKEVETLETQLAAAKSEIAKNIIEKKAFLENRGWTVGKRNPQLNTDHPGKFMCVEPFDVSELPTKDGANGPWCVVGDDLNVLVAEAFCFVTELEAKP
ncbi:Lar family restriction alleviation protein [Ochrobactrum sp. Marseille-Q0166]|uniref:Lar family restriction alleviation protein n=1 Tax=Ochrobactrum sp. Marseille-Q0166 TaxID=2761105 RepID=UPI001654C2E9|nr:Lar family restriction alleviation protein [Ochrobactrum sp. Marseille-Q0166]MBC8719260.1 Lar family restriction alleviation protein [Ochrobactrum sp. Marseille-Q0166]